MEICKQSDCTGCGACMAVCNHCAIAMRPDGSGHIYPHIFDDRCVECGLCVKICPANNPISLYEPISTYALHAKSDAVREKSSSGGAATLLAEAIVGMGGVVYACVQDNYRNIYHCRIDKPKDIGRIRGSKYVQSDMRNAYTECTSDLEAGRKVLFIGTPCQISGLRASLDKNYEGLYTVDIVCHGVPSQLLFRDNFDMLRSRADLTEQSCCEFRRKKGSKIRFGMYIHDGNKMLYSKDYPNDYFIAGFMKGLFFRPSCFNCSYAQLNRAGDITLGDFWGLGADGHTSMNVNKGVSLFMVNTPRGETLLQHISKKAAVEQRTAQEVAKGNHQLRSSFAKPADYDEFHDCYRQHGYEEACKQHLDFYIKRNRIVMMNENYPWLTLPFRAVRKILRRFKGGNPPNSH